MKTTMKLISYSSGDGSLTLTWRDGDDSANKPVSRTDAIRYLNRKRNDHLRERGWRVMWDGHWWRLVQPWQRLSADLFYNDEHGVVRVVEQQSSQHLTAEFRHKRKWYELRNWSTIGTLLYFLNHEGWITIQANNFRDMKNYPRGLHSSRRYVDPTFGL